MAAVYAEEGVAAQPQGDGRAVRAEQVAGYWVRGPPRHRRSDRHELWRAIHQELNTIRTAKIEIVANHLLKELPSTHGVIEHLGEADLHLQDGQPITKARRCIVRS